MDSLAVVVPGYAPSSDHFPAVLFGCWNNRHSRGLSPALLCFGGPGFSGRPAGSSLSFLISPALVSPIARPTFGRWDNRIRGQLVRFGTVIRGTQNLGRTETEE